MKKITSLLLALLLTFTLILLPSCQDDTETPKTNENQVQDNQNTSQGIWKNATYKESTTLGQGEKTFTLKVSADGKSINITVNTNENILGDALSSLSIIEGENGPYGLYVKKVNNITADYDVDQTYWALYINGEYAMTGVDTTEIVSGATYTLSREK